MLRTWLKLPLEQDAVSGNPSTGLLVVEARVHVSAPETAAVTVVAPPPGTVDGLAVSSEIAGLGGFGPFASAPEVAKTSQTAANVVAASTAIA
jgi:hypothetical protein